MTRPEAARYAGMRTRRKIVAVMAISGGGRRHRRRQPDRRFLARARPPRPSAAGYGYTGIVVAALALYNPFAVVVVAFLLGALTNAGYALQGTDFPSGLVGTMQGIILFCVLGGEILVRYRIRIGRAAAEPARRRRRPVPSRGSVVKTRTSSSSLASRRSPTGRRCSSPALGELLAERSGVLNLGVEGMMLIGGGDGFWRPSGCTGPRGSCLSLAVLVAAPPGAAMAHPRLPGRSREGNQIVSGLALTIFAGAAGSRPISATTSDSAAAGLHQFERIDVLGLQGHADRGTDHVPPRRPRLPSWVLVALVAWYLSRTRRAVRAGGGESPARPTPWGSTSRATATRTHRRRRLRRRRRGVLHASRSPRSGRRADRRGGLDRDRARHLRVLAARPASSAPTSSASSASRSPSRRAA